MEMAQGHPTKEFFIKMLTRDIELSDAILDLLDNCLDGVVRMKGSEKKRTDPDYYKNYTADINISKDAFSIADNCGGIPRKVAEENAFRMGRTPTTDTGLPTVGIYGIGMKRAIFKMGRSAEVITKNNNQAYKVIVPKEWATAEHWNFPIKELQTNAIDQNGTTVLIKDLNTGIANLWSDDKLDIFVDDLTSAIKASYSLIIQKGFCIKINGKPVEALPVQLLISTGSEGVKPYIFKKEYDNVSVSLTIGFYAPPPSEDEIDEGNESKRSSADAGWTVVCNDRVVLYNDRSHLTGWGEAGVPQYHTQFIGIRGIVVFESNNPEELPMTTTKRGIDLSSPIYADVKNKMRDGLKLFISYTNKWKGRIQQEREYSKVAEKVPFTKILENDTGFQKSYGTALKSSSGGFMFKPELPKPPRDRKYVNIRYTRPLEEVSILGQYFYNDSSIEVIPSTIGELCFDTLLKTAQESGSENNG